MAFIDGTLKPILLSKDNDTVEGLSTYIIIESVVFAYIKATIAGLVVNVIYQNIVDNLPITGLDKKKSNASAKQKFLTYLMLAVVLSFYLIWQNANNTPSEG